MQTNPSGVEPTIPVATQPGPETTDHHHHHHHDFTGDLPRMSELTGVELSPRLYNKDLAPTRKAGRTWTAYSIFTLWANDVHSLGNYAFAVGLFALGMGAWQILLALGVGAVLLFLLLNFSGFMGQKTGVPFPVMSRISFGIRGAQIASVVRGAVAVAWFGIQTYLASVIFRIMIIKLIPDLAPLDRNDVLGLSTLGWIAFVILWII
ncbi:MAG: cytosine permease, partial [Arthrobacter sp.]|nr:cytosine permease [Arthrobacter sp.]